MKGNNDIVFCQLELIRAIEYYLNEQVFTYPHTVTSIHVRDEGLSESYIVTLTEEKHENIETKT